MNLTLNLEEELSILDKYGLTPSELLVVRILLILQDDNNEQLLHQMINTFKKVGIKLREVLIELQNKEIILKSYKIPESGTGFDPYSIPINKNFIKYLYKCSFELGKELFESYPQWTTINNSISNTVPNISNNIQKTLLIAGIYLVCLNYFDYPKFMIIFIQ